MSAQTPMNGATESPSVGDVTSDVSSLAHDLITLAELQARLLFVDVREMSVRSAASVAGLAATVAIGLGAVLILLWGTAELLVDFGGWSRGVAGLTVGAVAAAIAIVVGRESLRRLKRVTTVLSRTHYELQQNLEFVKSLVQGANGHSEEPPYSRRMFGL